MTTTIDYTVLYWVVVAVMGLGVIGELVPGLPGSGLILAAILAWAVLTQFTGVGWPVLVVVAILILSIAVDFLATYWGAKQFGASKWGQLGAILGLVAGIFGLLPAVAVGGPIVGALVGPFIGAFIGEYLTRSPVEGQSRVKIALKASLGTVVGSLVGSLIEVLLAILAVAIFVFSTWPLVQGL
ncbi:DUF456 family protein [Pseudanabaena sp. FACHB-2040]|uniref:DUF456 domain-containing protein n=1 Tax=Pseudanabaena sp. FACHB-2040 TaxID=2692859 RepID=UPI001686DFA3|nr:DUF456 family protein [Pseudanabaena sp. FACHB-2040]MBD2258463.1 DUF456 family protein [Pseudanabaena sp. FACHB-2040]